jgi:hypothetical protein
MQQSPSELLLNNSCNFIHDCAILCQELFRTYSIQDEQDAKRRGWYGEKIDCDDVAQVVVEKSPPGLRWRLASPGYQPRNGSLGDFNAELLQFAMDSRRAPQRVGLRHLFDQRSELGCDCRPPGALLPRQTSPIETESLAMPCHNGLRFNNRFRMQWPGGPPKRAIQITQRGLDVLSKKPKRIDVAFLKQFPEFLEFQNLRRASSAEESESLCQSPFAFLINKMLRKSLRIGRHFNLNASAS